jgi:hypothetical protein
LGKATWTPNWVLENRTPAFITGGIGVTFGGKKFLWGNVPALDVLRLDSNEGEKYQRQLNLLFGGMYFARGNATNCSRLTSRVTF